MPWFKVYVGQKPEYRASSFEKARALALPLLEQGRVIRIECQDTAEAWVYNPATGAWEAEPIGNRDGRGQPEP